jgi:S1-C subfamily serine protease
MKYVFGLAVLLAGCSSLVFKMDDALTMRRLVEKSIVRVLHETGGGGTGFVVMLGSRKVVVTNDHVCGEESYELTALSDHTRERYPLTIIAATSMADLCIADILGAEALPPLRLAATTPELGTTVYTFGHPLLRSLRLESGQVEEYLPGFIPPAYATNIFALPGQSGSPVLNSRLEVVGVLFAIDRPDTHTAYVIPVEMLHAMMHALEKEAQNETN